MDRAKGADSCARGAIPRRSKSRARAWKGTAHFSESRLFTTSCFCRQANPPPQRRVLACIGTNTLKHHAIQLQTKARGLCSSFVHPLGSHSLRSLRASFLHSFLDVSLTARSTSQRADRRRDAAEYSPPARDTHGDKRPRANTPFPSQTQPLSPRPLTGLSLRFAFQRPAWCVKLGIGERGFSFARRRTSAVGFSKASNLARASCKSAVMVKSIERYEHPSAQTHAPASRPLVA